MEPLSANVRPNIPCPLPPVKISPNPPEAGARYGQKFAFQSADWNLNYGPVRNANEGLNGYLKDQATFALSSSGRRRARGSTAQFLFSTIIVVAANMRRIVKFLNERVAALKKRKVKTREPRRITNIQDWRPAQRSDARPDDPPKVA